MQIEKTLGVYTPEPTIPDLYSTLGLCISRPSCGKSTLFGSDPDILRLDFDRKGAAPLARGPIWPAPGHRIVWKDLLYKGGLSKVLDAVKPKTVAIDTSTTVIDCIKPYVEEKCGNQMFRDIAAFQSWDILRSEFLNLIDTIRDHGVGVWVLCHLMEKTIKKGLNTEPVREERVYMADSLWGSLVPRAAVKFWLTNEDSAVTKPRLDKSGNPMTIAGKPVLDPTGSFESAVYAVFKCSADRHPTMHQLLRGAWLNTPDQIGPIPMDGGFAWLNAQFQGGRNA